MDTHSFEVFIIGAGPAGLSAAIQLRRYGLSTLILEREAIGGLLRNANLVENYPGFPKGIRGPGLVHLFSEQVRLSGLDVTFEEVLELDYDEAGFQATTPVNGYRSKVAVIASGTKPRPFTHLHIPPHLSQFIYYEVHPLIGISGKHIVIVGAGDAAFDYALNLSSSNDVTILNRSQRLSCLPLLWERANASPRISYYSNIQITEIKESPSHILELHCPGYPGHGKITADYLIGALGRDPQLDFLSVSLGAQREILQKKGLLHIIGDVTTGIYRQTSIAVGQGVLAAMKISQYLEERTV